MIQASYKYPDGSEYKGEWNAGGQRHGIGKNNCLFHVLNLIKIILSLSDLKGILILNDGTKYMGEFENGLCNGLGLVFG